MRLVYPDEPRFPRCGALLSCDTGDTYHCAFYASAYGNMGDIHSPPLGDYVFPYGAYENIKLIRKMVDTRQPPVPYPEILEGVAVSTRGGHSAQYRKADLAAGRRIRALTKNTRDATLVAPLNCGSLQCGLNRSPHRGANRIAMRCCPFIAEPAPGCLPLRTSTINRVRSFARSERESNKERGKGCSFLSHTNHGAE